MPNITPDQLKDWLQLPDTELRDKLQELLPYRPETLYLAPATHPDYGEVHVISTKVDHAGAVKIIFLGENEYVAEWVYIPIAELTFTKPAKPRQLVTLEDIENAPVGTVTLGGNANVPLQRVDDYFWRYGDERRDSFRVMERYAPLTVLEPAAEPVAAPVKPAHPEWWGWDNDDA